MVRFSVIVVWPSVLGLYNHLNSQRGTETQNGMCILGKESNLCFSNTCIMELTTLQCITSY